MSKKVKAKKKAEEETAKTPQERRMEGLFKAMQKAGIPIERMDEIWEYFPEFIYQKLEEKGDMEAVEWSVGEIKEYLRECRLKDWGNPAIQTGFAKKEFTESKAMVKCVGGFQTVRDHQWVKNVPPEMLEMVEGEGNWRDWAMWMHTEGHLTDQEYHALLRAPFLMHPGEGLLTKPKKRKRKKRR